MWESRMTTFHNIPTRVLRRAIGADFCVSGHSTNKQTNKQTSKRASKSTSKQTSRPPNKQINTVGKLHDEQTSKQTTKLTMWESCMTTFHKIPTRVLRRAIGADSCVSGHSTNTQTIKQTNNQTSKQRKQTSK